MSVLRTPVNFESPYDVTSLPAHFAQVGITPCVCLYVTSIIDGTVKAATSFSSDLSTIPGYPGVTFKSVTGAAASNVESQQGQAPTNMEIDLFLLTVSISEADILAGKWAGATAIIFLTNYETPKMGQYILAKGDFGQITQRGQMFSTEIMGLNNRLSRNYGKVTRPECSHTFCDAGCTLDVGDFTVTGDLTAVTSQTVFRDSSRTEANDAFGNGVITFTSGNNSGYSFHIDAYDNSTKEFTLRTPTPYMPVIGDDYSAVIGCRKRHAEDCVARFDNVLNYSGFPWIPTLEEFQKLPVIQ